MIRQRKWFSFVAHVRGIRDYIANSSQTRSRKMLLSPRPSQARAFRWQPLNLALHAGGFTPRVLRPFEEAELLSLGYGITSFVNRATATAAELSDAELVSGALRLQKTVRKYRPAMLAILGIGAYRTGFGRKKAALDLQAETIGDTPIWVLPNPGGLNAHQTAASLAKLFAELRNGCAMNNGSHRGNR
jgi:G:T/U-mismatch repair DNA glycosylase